MLIGTQWHIGISMGLDIHYGLISLGNLLMGGIRISQLGHVKIVFQ